MKKIIYIDMDNVLVDFKSGIDRLPQRIRDQFPGGKDIDDAPGIFALMEPMPGAREAIEQLKDHFELYILSTAPWNNPSAWKHKIEWVQLYFGEGPENPFFKRLILSHNKHLNRGDYLIDDRPNNGAKDFKGEWIHYQVDQDNEWARIATYIQNKEGII